MKLRVYFLKCESSKTMKIRQSEDKLPWMREKPYFVPDIFLDLVQDELTKCLTDLWGGAVKSLK